MTQLTLRQAQQDTHATGLIRALAQRIWREHYVPIIGSEQVEYMLEKFYNDQALLEQMSQGQVFWFVEQDAQVLGYVSVTEKAPGQYFMHKFYIENGQRGKGLGKDVFNLLLEQYPDLQELRLTVNRQNFKSINFYFKVGFIIECCLDIPIGDGYEMNDFQMRYKKRP